MFADGEVDEFLAGFEADLVTPGARDGTPDINRDIFCADAPSIRLTSATHVASPNGSVAALRFNGHEWISLNRGLASTVATWHSTVTLKKISGVWFRVGAFNEIGGGTISLDFTAAEGQSY